jgi:ankyrin repeat protein
LFDFGLPLIITLIHLSPSPTLADKNLRTSEFRFDTKNYLGDEALISDLKALGNSSDAMVAYLKARFGTIREPGVEPSTAPTTTTTATATATIYQGSLVNSNQPAPAAVPPHLQQQIKQEGAPVEHVLTIKSARGYVKEFKDTLLKKMRIVAKKQGKSTEIALTAKEEKECEVRALHKAAWDGQAIAAFDLATRIGNFNAVLNFNYTPLHQVVLGSVGAKRRTNLLTAERLIKTGDSGAHVNAQDVFGRTPLHHASRRGDLDMMDLLIAKGAEVNAVAKNGSTPLHCAAESGGVDAVQKLLDAGATQVSPLARVTFLDNSNRQNSVSGLLDPGSLGLQHQISRGTSGSGGGGSSGIETPVVVQECGTALHWAARSGQYAVVDLLIKINYDVNALDWHGTTPLAAAAREYKDVFPDRLEFGEYRDYIRNYRKKKELNPPPPREDKGDSYFAVMRYLLGHGADREIMDSDGRTALHVAAACGNLKCVKLLLSGKKADNTMYSKNDMLGYNPLMLTVIKSEEPDMGSCSAEMASVDSEREFWKGVDELMGSWKVNDNMDLRGRTALHLAVLGGKTKVAEHLIELGATINMVDFNGATPLLLAARAQQRACVELLLSKGAEPNAMDKFGCTSLSAAALAGDIAIVDLLLEKKADVNLQKRSEDGHAGDAGRTALHDAAEAGDRYIVERLIEHGASVTHASEHGKTPLHVAARYGNADVVHILVDALKKNGGSINAVDCKGRTALKIAEQHGITDVVELLKQESDAVFNATEPSQQQQQQQQPCGDDPEDVEYSDWRSRFNILKAFVRDYKRVPAPDEWFKGYPLGSWVELQKEKIRWDEMAEDEFAAIGSVGNYLKDWGAGVPWMDWLQNVKEFVAANDHLPSAVAPTVLSRGAADQKLLDLGWWCKFQQCRKAGKEGGNEKSSLNDGQIKELKALRQWKWETEEDRRRRRFFLSVRLRHFLDKNGRFPRPDEHYLGVPLGKWCEVIRKLKLWGDLPKEREEALETCVQNKDKTEIFPGSTRELWNKYRPTVEDYLECLHAFVKDNQRHPSRKDVGSQSLNVGIWLNNQKQKWKNGKLAADVQKRIEEIFKSNSVSFRWPVDRNSAGGAGDAGDVEMEVAAAVAEATVPPEKKVSKVKAEEEEEYVDAALDLNGTSSIAKKIRSWKAKTSESVELKTAELVEYFQVCRKYKLEVVAQLPSKPAAGSAFFLQRGSKYKQDGYAYKKESNTKLKGKQQQFFFSFLIFSRSAFDFCLFACF